MKTRPLGRTGFSVSEVSLGAWQIGGAWGTVPDSDAVAVVHAAIDSGVNFIDTADVYGDGRSERFIAQVVKDRSEPIIIATKRAAACLLTLPLATTVRTLRHSLSAA